MSSKGVRCKWTYPEVVKPKMLFAGSAIAYIKAVGFDHVNAGLCVSPKCVRSKFLLETGKIKRDLMTGKMTPYWKTWD